MTKTYRNFQVWALMLTVLFLGACSSQKSAYESLVPASNNDLVLAINVDRLLSKSDILEKIKSFPQLEEELASSSFNEMVKLFRQDPKNLGLNLSSNIYFIVTNNAEDVTIAASMADVSKFEKFIETNKELAEVEVSEEAGFKVAVLSGGYKLLYNKEIFIFTTVDDYLDYVTKSEKHISDFKYAQTLQTPNDIALITSPNAMVNLIKSSLFADRSLVEAMDNIANSEFYANSEGLYTAMTLNFEKGELVFDQKNYTETEKAAEYMAKMEKMTNKPSDKYAKAIAKDPYFYMLANFDGKLIVDELFSVMKAYLPSENPEAAEVLDVIKNIIGYIKGDILFALSELNISFMGVTADMSLLIESDAKALYGDLRNLIITKTPGIESYITVNTDEQLVISQSGFTMYLGHNGNTFYFTTNEEIAKNPARTVAEDLTSSRYFDKSMPNASVVLDFKKLMKNPMIQMGLSSLGSDADLKNFIGSLDYVSSVGKTGSSKTVLVLDNKEVNSLATITQLIISLTNQ